MSSQHSKIFALTVVAAAAIEANRLIAYDGTYATSAGGVKDCQGVSEFAAPVDTATSVVAMYSYPVEASAAIAFGDYIKPAADGSGRAAIGTIGDHCGRALGAAAAAGALFEMQIVKHVHA
ncbi:MAG: capsid cement protein [Burkholderiaceae bacterium]